MIMFVGEGGGYVTCLVVVALVSYTLSGDF